MEMHPINNHLHHHHQHLPFLPQSHPSAAAASTDFDAVFAGVSLQSLLLGEPVLLTPPPPPFPPTPPAAPTPIIPALALPHPLQQFRDRGFPPLQPPPPTFFFQAAGAPSSVKPRCRPRRNHSATAVPHPQPRKQRQKVSDKLKALRRMVPCDQKADIATMLEQAYRYVRYLEVQVLALLTMNLCPLEERGLSFPGGGGGESEIERRMLEAVGRLSRKEVVEAVVNSGAAQRVMSEEGLCLVSEEQVRVLCLSTFQKQKQQQQQQQQQQLSGLIGGCAANPGNNNNNNTTNDSNNNSSSSSFSNN